MHWPKRVCLDLQRVLNMSPRNEKALYRMGQLLLGGSLPTNEGY